MIKEDEENSNQEEEEENIQDDNSDNGDMHIDEKSITPRHTSNMSAKVQGTRV